MAKSRSRRSSRKASKRKARKSSSKRKARKSSSKRKARKSSSRRKRKSSSRRKRKPSGWIKAVSQARKELGITGFHAIKKRTPLYERAKEIYGQ